LETRKKPAIVKIALLIGFSIFLLSIPMAAINLSRNWIVIPASIAIWGGITAIASVLSEKNTKRKSKKSVL